MYHPEWSKIELCGSLTTKDLKKPHSPRRLGQGEMQEAQRGAAMGTNSPIPTCDGLKMGGIPREQGISAPVQNTQPRVPAPGR